MLLIINIEKLDINSNKDIFINIIFALSKSLVNFFGEEYQILLLNPTIEIHTALNNKNTNPIQFRQSKIFNS